MSNARSPSPARAAPGHSAPRNVLVIGASTGYGLASRIAAAWGYGARTLGVFFERPPDGDKTATAGYYNTVALHERAKRDGLFAASINGDAFSDACKREAIDIVRRELAPLDLVIYSLASPKRTDPRTGCGLQFGAQAHRPSLLEPHHRARFGKSRGRHARARNATKRSPTPSPSWVARTGACGSRRSLDEGLLAPGARTLAYSYIGPEITWPIYRDGTIGRAKHDLEQTARSLDAALSRQARRARLGLGEQGRGDASLGGDSRRAACI